MIRPAMCCHERAAPSFNSATALNSSSSILLNSLRPAGPRNCTTTSIAGRCPRAVLNTSRATRFNVLRSCARRTARFPTIRPRRAPGIVFATANIRNGPRLFRKRAVRKARVNSPGRFSRYRFGNPYVSDGNSSPRGLKKRPGRAACFRPGLPGRRQAMCLAVRGKSPPAFERRCIPPDCVARRSNMPNILAPRVLPGGRRGALGATPDFCHGLLDRQPLAALGPAGIDCPATGTRRHARPEAMPSFPLQVTGLERPFHVMLAPLGRGRDSIEGT